MTEQPNIRLLVRWLGAQGAKAGILDSKLWPIDALKAQAAELGLKVTDKITRKELIDELIRVANKRINKSLDELYSMDEAQIKDYFTCIGVESEELLELLKIVNLSPRREGTGSLIAYAARELAETGRFMRIAGKIPTPPPSEGSEK